MTGFLILAFLILVAGVLAVPLATRLGLGSVLGYLLAGMAISPLLAALSVDVEALQVFAEFGVVMMLFIIGLGDGAAAPVGDARQAHRARRRTGRADHARC